MANEMRLIDAYAFFENLVNNTPVIAIGEQKYVASWRVTDLIADAPTVDAAPVVHGRWEAVDDDCEGLDGETESMRWGCTHCRKAEALNLAISALASDNYVGHKVQVVRCKDCKHWHEETGWCDHHSHFIDSNGGACHPWESIDWKMLDEDDFCSYGERKDNDQNY